MNTWAELRSLRQAGIRPSLPVMVTTSGMPPAWLLESEGFMVIKHEAGQLLPVELLDDLRVLLFVGNCDRASAVVRAMRGKGVRPSELRAWCPCFARLDRAPVSCETAGQWA